MIMGCTETLLLSAEAKKLTLIPRTFVVILDGEMSEDISKTPKKAKTNTLFCWD